MPEREGSWWVMPAWMEPYRGMIGNTGGNSIEELMNDQHTTARSNLIRAALIASVTSQVGFLYRMWRAGMLAAGTRCEESRTHDPHVTTGHEPASFGPLLSWADCPGVPL